MAEERQCGGTMPTYQILTYILWGTKLSLDGRNRK